MDKYPFFVLLKIQWKSLVRISTIFYILWISFHNLAIVATNATKSHRCCNAHTAHERDGSASGFDPV